MNGHAPMYFSPLEGAIQRNGLFFFQRSNVPVLNLCKFRRLFVHAIAQFQLNENDYVRIVSNFSAFLQIYYSTLFQALSNQF